MTSRPEEVVREALEGAADALEMEGLEDSPKRCRDALAALDALVKRVEKAESDLKAYVEDTAVTCAYCGARHDRPVSFEDIRAHVQECPKHPMAALRAENERLKQGLWPKSMVDLHDENERLKAELVNQARIHAGIERKPDHLFVPGDAAYGWERQCSVVVPVAEAGEVVGAHCGYPPEAHPQVTYPKPLPTREGT